MWLEWWSIIWYDDFWYTIYTKYSFYDRNHSIARCTGSKVYLISGYFDIWSIITNIYEPFGNGPK